MPAKLLLSNQTMDIALCAAHGFRVPGAPAGRRPRRAVALVRHGRQAGKRVKDPRDLELQPINEGKRPQRTWSAPTDNARNARAKTKRQTRMRRRERGSEGARKGSQEESKPVVPGHVCSGRSCERGARVRRGCAAGAWAPAWVRGGGAWRRGRAACVSRVPRCSDTYACRH